MPPTEEPAAEVTPADIEAPEYRYVGLDVVDFPSLGVYGIEPGATFRTWEPVCSTAVLHTDGSPTYVALADQVEADQVETDVADAQPSDEEASEQDRGDEDTKPARRRRKPKDADASDAPADPETNAGEPGGEE